MFASTLNITELSRFLGTLHCTSIGSSDGVMDRNEIMDWLLAWEVDVTCFLPGWLFGFAGFAFKKNCALTRTGTDNRLLHIGYVFQGKSG